MSEPVSAPRHAVLSARAPGDALRLAAMLTRREQAFSAAASGYPSPVLLPDKLAALESASRTLREAGIAHSLIGGLAVGVRTGVARATLDVDLAIPSTADRAHVVLAMTTAGFVSRGEHAHSLNFAHPTGEPVQLALDPAFDPMIERAELVVSGDFSIAVVTKDDLIVMKRRAAADPARRKSKALRDLADVALLEEDEPGEDEGW